MPNVTNFVFCEEPKVDGDNSRGIKPLQTIDAVGGDFSFGILFTLTGISASEDHTLFIAVSSPNGERIFETEKFTLDKEEHEETDTRRLVAGISMGVEFNELLFEGQGLYKVDLIFDDEKLGEFYIPVFAQKGSDR